MQFAVEEALAVKLERTEARQDEETAKSAAVQAAEQRTQQTLEQLRKADK